MKELAITGGKISEKILIKAIKAMFPEGSLPPGATVDYALEEKEE